MTAWAESTYTITVKAAYYEGAPTWTISSTAALPYSSITGNQILALEGLEGNTLNCTAVQLQSGNNVTVSGSSIQVTGAGTATINVVRSGHRAINYYITATKNKSQNPLTYTSSQTVNTSFSSSAQTATLTAAANGQGTVSYAINSQKNSSNADVSYFSLDGTTLSIAASAPVGTYTVVVRATAAGNDDYNSGTMDSTVTVGIRHDHAFTYSLNAAGDTITATCTAEDCPLENKTATLTIAPPSEGGNTAVFTGDTGEFDLTGVTITYQKKDSTGWQGTDAPGSDASGIFKASVTLKGTDNVEATAFVTYGVSAVTHGTATNPTGKSYDFTVPKVAAVGAKITPTPTTELDTGYGIKQITVKDENGTDVSTDVSADKTGFIMPEYNVTVDMSGANGFQIVGCFTAENNTPVTLEVDSITINGKYNIAVASELTNTREWADGLRNIWNGFSDGEAVYTDDYAVLKYIKADDAIELFAAENVEDSNDAPLVEKPLVFTAKVKGKGSIELHLDEPTGKLLTSITFDSPNEFANVYSDLISNIGGTHDIYFVYSGQGISMQSWIFVDSGETLAKLMGDVNADGKFDIAYVVLLQKWLLAVPDTKLPDWKAADFYADNKLNIFDLCLMKRKLIYG